MPEAAYSHLAAWYEQLMDADYDSWAAYLNSLMGGDPAEKAVLDLGCGTGVLTRRMADLGWRMTGVDASADMLNAAWQQNRSYRIPLIQQSLTELDLEKQYDVIISTCDVFNYLLEEKNIKTALCGIADHLKPGGAFLFDISSRFKLSTVLGNSGDSYVSDELCYIWDNFWDDESSLLTMELTFFRENPDGSYERSDEEHIQRGWRVEELKKLIEGSDLKIKQIYGAFTEKPYTDTDNRIQFVLEK